MFRFLFRFLGSLVQEQHAAGAHGHDPDDEPRQPTHSHTQLHQVWHGLRQLLLRRGKLTRNFQVSTTYYYYVLHSFDISRAIKYKIPAEL